MNLLRKFLRGIYYFCVGIKAATREFTEWYTTNKSVPRALRNRASLAVITLALVAGSWGLVSSISGMDMERRELPVSQNKVEDEQSGADAQQSEAPLPELSQPAEPEPEPASNATAEPEKDAEQAPEEPSPLSSGAEVVQLSTNSTASTSSDKPEVDAVATATRFTPVSAQQLTETLAQRVKQYYEVAKASGIIFTPPAAGDITAWKGINSDVMGWISISNTNINYPVVKGSYTDYYTYRGYYKESSRNGVIWVDSDTKLAADGSITSQNTVVYGHNWTNCWRPVRIGNPNDIMFAQLAAYDDAGFTASNPYIRLATADGDHMYQIFAVFYTDLSFGYNYADLPGNGILNIANTAKAKSIHKLNVPVSATDKIITLSTCTRVLGAGDNQRFVVMGKKIS